MAASLGSSISNPTVFTPINDKLEAYKQKLTIITNDLSTFHPAAYKSIQDFVTGFKLMKADISTQIAVVVKQQDAATATLSASIAAKSPDGAAMSIKNIAWCVQEIQAAIKCFELVGQIIIGLAKIVGLLILKVIELGKLYVTLAMNEVMKYLNEIKNDIIATVNKIKTTVVNYVLAQTLTKKEVDTKQIIASDNKLIAERKQILSNGGMDTNNINQDPQIKIWQDDILNKQGTLKVISDQLMATGFRQT